QNLGGFAHRAFFGDTVGGMYLGPGVHKRGDVPMERRMKSIEIATIECPIRAHTMRKSDHCFASNRWMRSRDGKGHPSLRL
ncbi:MAG: hypothetical protein AAFY31_07145, partial [Pseudomonadota bacterium]